METTGFYRFKTPWLRKAQDEGIQKGIEKGIKKGLKKGIETGLKTGIKKGIEKGIVRGEVNGRVAALLALAEARELRLSAAQRKRIRETRSLRQLDRWLRRAATAESASGLFPQ